MRRLSPELTLIDADLASDARAALPPARDVLAEVARHWESEPIRNLRAALAPDAAPKRRRRRAPVLRLVAGGLAGLGAIAGAALVFWPQTSGQAARVPSAPARPSVVQATHPVPAHLPVLTWAADRAASHYRVGLSRNGIPLREVWTDDAQLALSSVSTPGGRPLARGAYRWVVYPVFGGDGWLGSGNTSGPPLAQGTFTL
jgi:hypothetical protein